MNTEKILTAEIAEEGRRERGDKTARARLPLDWQVHLRISGYFRSKRPANFLRSPTCQVAGICLASNMKAGLPGW